MRSTEERLDEMVFFILYSAGVLLVGFLGGMMAKHIIDKDAIRELELKNRALHRENVYLNRIRKGQVIEISDERVADVSFGGF